METGVVDKAIGPEVRTQPLFRDRYVVVVRAGHPLSKGDVTPLRFAEAARVHVLRRDGDKGPIGSALADLGLGACRAWGAAMGLQIRQELSSLGPLLAIDAPSPTGF